MAVDSELKNKLQLFMVAAILLAGGLASYIIYKRHEAMKKETKPQDTAMKADYYVTPKRLRPYDLKSARQLTEQPVWVKVGYQLTYYPYDRQRRKADFGHPAGTLPPLQKLSVQDVVTDISPLAVGTKQVMAVFLLEGKVYAVPVGAE